MPPTLPSQGSDPQTLTPVPGCVAQTLRPCPWLYGSNPDPCTWLCGSDPDPCTWLYGSDPQTLTPVPGCVPPPASLPLPPVPAGRQHATCHPNPPHLVAAGIQACALDSTADWASSLSLGEQQRLAWARLLLARPQLALLDEASSALDQDTEAELYQVIAGSISFFFFKNSKAHSQALLLLLAYAPSPSHLYTYISTPPLLYRNTHPAHLRQFPMCTHTHTHTHTRLHTHAQQHATIATFHIPSPVTPPRPPHSRTWPRPASRT